MLYAKDWGSSRPRHLGTQSESRAVGLANFLIQDIERNVARWSCVHSLANKFKRVVFMRLNLDSSSSKVGATSGTRNTRPSPG